MAPTMHAAVVEKFGKPLVFQEWAVPTPSPGQILVKTEACGVCHTDLHAIRGDWPVKPTLPFIPGHEGIGVVAAVGAGVSIVKAGDRVGVPWLYSACGQCEYCLAAREPVCAEAQFGGYTKNGGFADEGLLTLWEGSRDSANSRPHGRSRRSLRFTWLWRSHGGRDGEHLQRGGRLFAEITRWAGAAQAAGPPLGSRSSA